MSLVLIDGFDWRPDATSNIDFRSYLGKWTWIQEGFVTSNRGRYSTKGLVAPLQLTKFLDPSEEDSKITVGYALRYGHTGGTANFFVEFGSDSQLNYHAILRMNAFFKRFELIFRDGTTLFSPTINVGPKQWFYVEFQLLLSSTSSGYYEVKLDGTTVMSGTRQTKFVGTKNTLDYIKIYYQYDSDLAIDDVYITNGKTLLNNSFLGDIRVDILYPNASGTYNQFLPSVSGQLNYEMVDDATLNTTDFVTSSGNATDTYNFQNTPDNISQVFGVESILYARKTGSQVKLVKPIIYTSGALYYAPSGLTLSQDYTIYSSLFETNPTTSGLWNPSEIDNTEFGFYVYSGGI